MASGEGLVLPIVAAAVGLVGAISCASLMHEGQGDQLRAEAATIRQYQGEYAPGDTWPAPYDKSMQLPDGTTVEAPYNENDITKATDELNGEAFREDLKDWSAEGGRDLSLLVFVGGAAGVGVTLLRRRRLNNHHDLREDLRDDGDTDHFLAKNVYKKKPR